MSAKSQPAAERFMAAVQAFEADGRAEPLVGLFAPEAEVSNLVHTARGADGVRRFWQEYRAAFREVRSTFTAVVAGENGAALEWESSGALPTGAPIRYRGVSVIELDGDRVRRFRTYYDTAAFAAPAVDPAATDSRNPDGNG
jgi:ketosteroid isomerase-like protein